MIQMQAFIYANVHEGCSCPWPIPDLGPFSSVRLWEHTPELETALILAQLAEYNHIELDLSKQSVINRISENDALILPGGIRVLGEGQREISPGCCCGLEEWREWTTILETRSSPWLGHD